MPKTEQIENTFAHHPPVEDQARRYNILREKGKELALIIDAICPDSREKALAQTNVEQAIMWANKSIAVNERPAADPS